MSLLNWTGLFGQNKRTKPTDLNWVDVKDRIYPMLKQTIPDSDTTPVINLKDNEKPIIDTYLADIHIAYLIDNENFFTYVNQGQLIKWNITKDSLSQIALINLDQLANVKAQFHGDSTYAMIILNGNVEASLMLSDNFWPNISDIVKSKDLIIGIPTRDVLLVTNLDCVDGLEKLRQGVKQTFEQGDHVITKWTFKRENGKWIKFEYIE
ncbi:MAG: hypothetical protein ACJA2S_005615 [Cyclobacteriaceae bacterium]|jgi:uncharacterized protein YtpQ (UPF0354 family)